MNARVTIAVVVCLLIGTGRIGAEINPGSGGGSGNSGGNGPFLNGSSNGVWANAINPLNYGLKTDGRMVYDGVVTNNSPTITSATANFTQADTGKIVLGYYCGAGGCLAQSGSGIVVGTIASSPVPNGTTATLTGNYTGTSQSKVAFWIETDSTAAEQAAINACGDTTAQRACVVLQPCAPWLMTSGLTVQSKNTVWWGCGMGNTASGQGSTLIWAGASGGHAITLQSSSVTMYGINVMGNSLTTALPDALVDFLQSGGFQPAFHNNVWNMVGNNYSGTLASWPDQGNPNGSLTAPLLPMSTRGVEWDSAGLQTDRNQVVGSAVAYATTCWYQGLQQAVEARIIASTCYGSTGGLSMPNGGDMFMEQAEFLNMGGTEIFLDGGARLADHGHTNENDSALWGSAHQVLQCGHLGCSAQFYGGTIESGTATDIPTGVLYDLSGVTPSASTAWPGAAVSPGALNSFILPPMQKNFAMMPFKLTTASGNTGASEPGWCQGPWPGAAVDTTGLTHEYILPPHNLNPADLYFDLTTPGITGGSQPTWTTCQTAGCTKTDNAATWTGRLRSTLPGNCKVYDGNNVWTATDIGANVTNANVTFNDVKLVGNGSHPPTNIGVIYEHPTSSNGSAPPGSVVLRGGNGWSTLDFAETGNTPQSGTVTGVRLAIGTSSNGSWIHHIVAQRWPAGSGDFGEDLNRWLVTTDTLGWGNDLLGLTTAYGGLALNVLPPPGGISTGTCVGGGSGTNYLWKLESCQDSTCTICGLPSTEQGPTSCAATLDSTTNYIQGPITKPQKGAAAYAVYATTGAANSETFAYCQPANQNYGSSNAWRLTSSVFSGAINAVDQTGTVQIGNPVSTPGASATAIVGQTGGSGPATAAQNGWVKVYDSTGAAMWVPVWK